MAVDRVDRPGLEPRVVEGSPDAAAHALRVGGGHAPAAAVAAAVEGAAHEPGVEAGSYTPLTLPRSDLV